MMKLATSCIAILIFTNLAFGQQGTQMSASEVINRVTEIYSSCSTYLDEGQEEAKDVNYGGRVSHRTFTTAFVRPSNFRFEELLSQPSKEKVRFIAWQAGAEASVWPSAKASPTGQTGPGSAYFLTLTRRAQNIVLGLLFPPGARRNTLYDLTDLKLAGQERVNGRLTFRIDGNLTQVRFSRDARGNQEHIPMPLPTSVWIDQQEFLILKIRQKHVGTLTITTTFKPVVNSSVPPEKLSFNPPTPAPDNGTSGVEVVDFHFSERAQKARVGANLTYVYELTIRNLGPKKITAVAWEHTFMDPYSKRLRRQTHFSNQKIEPNESEILRDEIGRGSSRVVDAREVNPEGDDNRVQVSCVIYADGSWWKDPAAKHFECEYLRALSLRQK
jgi:hypothetical protein